MGAAGEEKGRKHVAPLNLACGFAMAQVSPLCRTMHAQIVAFAISCSHLSGILCMSKQYKPTPLQITRHNLAIPYYCLPLQACTHSTRVSKNTLRSGLLHNHPVQNPLDAIRPLRAVLHGAGHDSRTVNQGTDDGTSVFEATCALHVPHGIALDLDVGRLLL